MTPAQQSLALDYLPLARAMARRFIAKCGDDHATAADLRQEAFLAVSQAASTFDPERGVHFATFASKRINGALADAFRRGMRGWTSCDSDMPIVDPGVEEVDRMDAVEQWLKALPPLKARVLREVHIDGVSQEAVARRIGLSKATMCRLHKDAVRTAKERFAGAM